jgi:hypothetical protein
MTHETSANGRETGPQVGTEITLNVETLGKAYDLLQKLLEENDGFASTRQRTAKF